MRKQIRGLAQASLNAQDGISAVQTAEGALNEVQDMLQRMNELAVKAANGTNSEDDRGYIQNEIDQLTTEIDRVAETTKFNETYLLKGNQDATKDYTYTYKAAANAKAATVTLAEKTTATAKGTKVDVAFTQTAKGEAQNEVARLIKDQGFTITYSNKVNAADATKVDNSASVSLNGTDEYVVTGTGTNFTVKDLDGNSIATITLTNDKIAASQAVANKLDGSETITATAATAGYAAGETMKYYDRDGNGIPENALGSYFSSTTGTDGAITTTARADAPTIYDALGNEVTADAANDVTAKQDLTGALSLTLHVGADATSNNQITLKIDSMSAKGLGVNGLKVDGTDDTNARAAVETIKEALQKVSTQRSALGAVQNRLEHTIANLDNVVENTTSAEAQIRDTDMATEMVKYSNNNILAQAGQAMLAQANQANQGVLSLLG